MRRVYVFRLTFVACQVEHGARDFVLAVRGQLAHRFESFFQELGHGRKNTPFACEQGRPSGAALFTYVYNRIQFGLVPTSLIMPGLVGPADPARPGEADVV